MLLVSISNLQQPPAGANQQQSVGNNNNHHHQTMSSPSPSVTVVFAVGLNNFGQLGLADHEDRLTAEMIDPSHFNGSIPLEAGAGEHHSLLLCANGQVYSFGRADSGQLGIAIPEGARAANIPMAVTTMPEPAHLIAAGGNHNLAVTVTGGLYSWGYGEMHQLGHGPDEVEAYPKLVQTPLKGKIVQVAAGGQHSIVLTRE